MAGRAVPQGKTEATDRTAPLCASFPPDPPLSASPPLRIPLSTSHRGNALPLLKI